MNFLGPIQLRGDTAANWTSNDPTLLAREVGIETDTGYWKIGDGVTAWTSLGYVTAAAGAHASTHEADGSDALPWTSVHGYGVTGSKPAAAATNEGYLYYDTTLSQLERSNGTTWDVLSSGAGVSDGDKGDITVSSSGAVWTIDNSVITLAKMANMATASLLGRNTAGTGVPEVLSAATVKTLLSLNNVENTALSTWAGSANIVTLGTIATGVWQGTNIDSTRLSMSATDRVVGRSTAGAGASEEIAFTSAARSIADDTTVAAMRTTLELSSGALEIVIDGGGSVIATGAKKVYAQFPFACTLTAYRILADQSGSIVIDVWKDSYANFPPTDADAMPGSGKEPTLTTATKVEDTDISNWDSVAISAGDIIEVNVDSATTVTKVTLVLLYTR